MNENTTTPIELCLDERYGRQEVHEDILVCTVVDVDLILIESLDSHDAAVNISSE